MGARARSSFSAVAGCDVSVRETIRDSGVTTERVSIYTPLRDSRGEVVLNHYTNAADHLLGPKAPVYLLALPANRYVRTAWYLRAVPERIVVSPMVLVSGGPVLKFSEPKENPEFLELGRFLRALYAHEQPRLFSPSVTGVYALKPAPGRLLWGRVHSKPVL